MKLHKPFALLFASCVSVLSTAGCQAQARLQIQTKATLPTISTLQDAGAPFGKLRLVDEIDCGVLTGAYEFSEAPVGISKVETILGKASRVLPRAGEAKYFAYRIGKGKGLKPGAAYVLAVEFPEDKSRSMFIVNRGAEMVRGVRTGQALGDVIYTHTNNNNESLKVPLSENTTLGKRCSLCTTVCTDWASKRRMQAVPEKLAMEGPQTASGLPSHNLKAITIRSLRALRFHASAFSKSMMWLN
jgi:hypothetical protein